MKKILLLLFISIYAFSLELQDDFLEPDEAFKTEFVKGNEKVTFN